MSVLFQAVRRHLLLLSTAFLTFHSSGVMAEEQEIEEVVVIGVTPTQGAGLDEGLIPYNIQSATSDDFSRTQSTNLADFLNRNMGSVSINAAQNNPLQPDVQFRGFTASPLLGLPQGISIYQNGVRINEPFGDTMNWNLIPESSIANINLVGGANPLYGLNTLGGALSIQSKNGFTHPGHRASASYGSFERLITTLESGGNNGTWGYFGTISYFDEDGWREASESDALNLFGNISYQTDDTTLNINVSRGDTDLIGNGSVPIQLLAQERDTFFTSPDITQNDMWLVSSDSTHWLNNLTQLSGNLFYRINDADSFNGDGTEFEACGFGANAAAGLICEDNADLGTAAEEVLTDQNGNPIVGDFDLDGELDLDAINNLSNRDQESFGGTLESTFLNDLFGWQNQAIIGGTYHFGQTDFNAQVEIASLNDDRSTAGIGLIVPDESTVIKTHTRTWSIYITDTINITDTFSLTLSGRYNNTSVKIGDRNLQAPEPDLNGEHDYDRFNPSAGITWQFRPNIALYASYSESNRAPTPIELACADPSAPCSLPNAFLADPPLDQVVAESWETGLRGFLGETIQWHVGGFRTENTDDIIFISTGGTTSNNGFFDNIGETQRLGMELGVTGTAWDRFDWALNYTYLQATFETDFAESSPNHPLADVNDDIFVENGDRIPGIPEHNLKLDGDIYVTNKFTLGGDVIYNSDQVLRGDEANLLDTIDGYAVVNVRGSYQIHNQVEIFAHVNNLFDKEYESFGLLGEPDEILGPSFDDPRFLSPGEPISGFIGIRINI